jgi:hypothetical protein
VQNARWGTNQATKTTPMVCPAPISPPAKIQLPRSSTRLQIPEVYCKLVSDLVPDGPFGVCRFEGKIYKPGAVVEAHQLPRPAVVIECCGQQGAWQRGKKRDYLYIVWTYDYRVCEWREIARALARDASWTAVVKEAVWRALYPQPQLLDVIERSTTAAEELVEAIDKRLRAELPEVRANALHRIYESVAGRMAECA